LQRYGGVPTTEPRRRSATYLDERGLVRTKNRRVQTVPFSDVDELLLWRAGGNNRWTGNLLSYYVVTRDGRKYRLKPSQQWRRQLWPPSAGHRPGAAPAAGAQVQV
jgi:hypothetical protein